MNRPNPRGAEALAFFCGIAYWFTEAGLEFGLSGPPLTVWTWSGAAITLYLFRKRFFGRR